MKYVDEYRDGRIAGGIAARIAAEASEGRDYHFMEFCGGHTHAISRYGLEDLLPANIRMIHGPGCPVCVLPIGRIDHAIRLAARPEITLCTYGDLMRVPGSRETLSHVRAEGAHVAVCYSPASAVELAMREPEREIVFLAIGFETTVAPVISIVEAARRDGVGNISLLTAFKLVPPALRALLDDPAIRRAYVGSLG